MSPYIYHVLACTLHCQGEIRLKEETARMGCMAVCESVLHWPGGSSCLPPRRAGSVARCREYGRWCGVSVGQGQAAGQHTSTAQLHMAAP